jgi:hypothetical protein
MYVYVEQTYRIDKKENIEGISHKIAVKKLYFITVNYRIRTRFPDKSKVEIPNFFPRDISFFLFFLFEGKQNELKVD